MKIRNTLYSIIMSGLMVYTMTCYNISIIMGKLDIKVFSLALREFIIFWPIAFCINFFIVKPNVIKKVNKIMELNNFTSPLIKTNLIIIFIITFMVPIMSLITSLYLTHNYSNIIGDWLHEVAINFPMAICIQLFYYGPILRFVFNKIFD